MLGNPLITTYLKLRLPMSYGGKILRALSTDLNYAPVDFCPSTLKSIMLAREEFGAQFGAHLDQKW
jgi:hypothetical protein